MNMKNDLTRACRDHREKANRFHRFLGNLPGALDLPHLAGSIEADEIEETRRRVQRFLSGDCNPTYRIALAGAYSVGKSQLINALVGRELLPQKLTETTFLPTVLTAGHEGRVTVWIRYLTQAEVEHTLVSYAKSLGRDDLPSTLREAQDLGDSEFEDIARSLSGKARFDDLPNFIRALRNPHFHGNISSNDSPHETIVSLNRLEEFVTRESDLEDRYLLSAVRIEIPDFPFEGDVEVVDLPGTDAADEWAKSLTHRYVKDVDALLLVGDATRAFTEAQDNMIREIQEWGSGHENRLFVVLNKADHYGVHPANQVLGAHRELRAGLRPHFGEGQPRLFYTSAASAIPTPSDPDEAHKCEEARKLLERIPTTGDPEVDVALQHAKDEGGVRYLKSELADFLATRATEVKLDALRSRWKTITDPVREFVQQAGRSAEDELARGSERSAEQCRVELRNMLEEVEREQQALRASLPPADGKRSADLDPLFKSSLSNLPQTICALEVDPGDAREPASQVANRRRDDLYAAFDGEVRAGVEKFLLADFLDRLEERIGGLQRRLAPIAEAAGRPLGGGASTSPRRAVLAALDLRLAEWAHRGRRHRPFRTPPGGTFSGFAEVFHHDMFDFFKAKIPQLETEIAAFLPIHMEWHLDHFADELVSVIEEILEGDLLREEPDRFAQLLQQSDAALVSNLQRVVDLRAELEGALENATP